VRTNGNTGGERRLGHFFGDKQVGGKGGGKYNWGKTKAKEPPDCANAQKEGGVKQG